MTEFTHVELEWVKGRIENWIRFGRTDEEHLIDSRQRVVSFAPGSIFDFPARAAKSAGARRIAEGGNREMVADHQSRRDQGGMSRDFQLWVSPPGFLVARLLAER
jgi:hypothetical protein